MSRVLFLALGACTAGTPVTDSGAEPGPFPGDPDYDRDPSLDIALASTAGSTASHETGEACMHCHQPNADGPGLFTAAGSVYRADGTPADGGSIQLWAGETLVIEVAVDANGNFYTTEDVGLPDTPVLPTVIDADGAVVNQMPWETESASCNQCHTPIRRVLMP